MKTKNGFNILYIIAGLLMIIVIFEGVAFSTDLMQRNQIQDLLISNKKLINEQLELANETVKFQQDRRGEHQEIIDILNHNLQTHANVTKDAQAKEAIILDKIVELAENPQTTLKQQLESFQDMKDIKRALNITD